jgi:hypothetical protein
MSRQLNLDPEPANTLDSLWLRNEQLADAIEEALDWIEADPPDTRAIRRRFSNGIWAISVHSTGQEWTVLWEETSPDQPVVRFIGETESI